MYVFWRIISFSENPRTLIRWPRRAEKFEWIKKLIKMCPCRKHIVTQSIVRLRTPPAPRPFGETLVCETPVEKNRNLSSYWTNLQVLYPNPANKKLEALLKLKELYELDLLSQTEYDIRRLAVIDRAVYHRLIDLLIDQWSSTTSLSIQLLP